MNRKTIIKNYYIRSHLQNVYKQSRSNRFLGNDKVATIKRCFKSSSAAAASNWFKFRIPPTPEQKAMIFFFFF